MELIDLVSELLYNKNCVIIPSFGGFVGNFKSTDFDSNRLLISPTRKKVAFNESLTENDGLLITALQKRKEISYEQAEKEVALFASFLRDRLLKYKNYEFKNLGSLYLNKEDKLIFVAYDGANFHKKSFGLSEVKIKKLVDAPIVKLTPQKAVQPQKSKIVPIADTQKKSKFYFPQVAASIAILSLFGVMLWQLLRTSADQNVQNTPIETKAQNETTASLLPDIDLGDSDVGDAEVLTEESFDQVETTMEYTDVTNETLAKKAQVIPQTIPEEIEVMEELPVKVEQEILDPIVKEIADEPIVETKRVAVKTFDPFKETVYYIAVAKNYTGTTEAAKRKKLERKEYSLFEVATATEKVLCIEKFISEKNAQDFLSLVKRYDDRSAFIFEKEE
ncbi:MAG: hypothetical protein ACI8SE_000457 [Bacteroidia bacterium]|jgi:hypothetical protein